MLTVTKEFTFDAAHFLRNYEGPCANMHGHTYKLQVTVTSHSLDKCGMLVDFAVLKKSVESHIVSQFDHRVINEVVEYNPTAENMVNDFARILLKELPGEIYLREVRLWETPTSFATWTYS